MQWDEITGGLCTYVCPSAEIVPPGLYHRLKLGILLSLVLCGRTSREGEDTQPQ